MGSTRFRALVVPLFLLTGCVGEIGPVDNFGAGGTTSGEGREGPEAMALSRPSEPADRALPAP